MEVAQARLLSGWRTMPKTTRRVVQQTNRLRRFSYARKIEHLLDWAEPTIIRVCGEVRAELRPRGLDIEDLYQEGRIATFQFAKEILLAGDPEALLATIIRRRVRNAIRDFEPWDTPAQTEKEDEPSEAERPMAAG
jgi:DNA-directed RNA polymerase specialized sigma24 family protein